MTDKKKFNPFRFDEDYLALEMPPTMEDYQMWQAYNERKIIFNENVDTRIINTVVHWIIKWNEEDDKAGLAGDQRKPIRLAITSNGGDVVAGLAACDAIRKSKTKVIGRAIGCAASMGILLLMACHEREAYENTVLLIHDGSLTVSGSSRKAKSTMGFYDKLDERVKKYILDQTTIKEEQYDEKQDEEWYMFADEALELGIIHSIV